MNHDDPTTPHSGSEDPTIPDSGDSPHSKSSATGRTTIPPPKRIGKYHILETLGEGGMGIVYLAEQTEPVRRRVALKVIKPGMDTEQVLARFESERQAMALMNHAHVAKVFDADRTEDGRPFFVMEHVPGVPITEYCDTHQLGLEERMNLFMLVCEAIQHAHQNGIIHRDIKPSNILVAIEGDRPVPKVIDFGVAKAVHHHLTERTLFTEQGQLIGTPEYMSPEQAEMTGLNVDTRTDIYALGVLLYELLSGSLPFEPSTLRQAAFDEIRRRIREDDPPKPSTRLSDLGEHDSQLISQHHHSSRAAMVKEMRGDLDWITMKALEKDRTRRYASAAELAADINRHLHHEPVLAGPPSAVYRAGKFVRRHRALVTGTAAVFVVLVAGIISSLLFAAGEARALTVAEEAMNLEKEARQEAEQSRDRADRLFQRGHKLARTFMGEFHDAIVELPATLPARQMLVEEAMSYLADIEADAESDADLTVDLAWGHRRIGQIMGGIRGPNLNRTDEALEQYATAVRLYEQVMEKYPQHRDNLLGLASSHRGLADLLFKQNREEEALRAYTQSLAICNEVLAIDAADDAALRLSSATELKLGDLMIQDEEYDRAREYYTRSLEIRENRAKSRPDDDRALRDLSVGHTRMAVVQDRLEDSPGARNHYANALDIRRKLLDRFPDSSRRQRDVMLARTYLGQSMAKMGESEEAGKELDQAMDLARHLHAVDPLDQRARMDLTDLLVSYGGILVQANRLEEGTARLAEALAEYRSLTIDFPDDQSIALKIQQLQKSLDEMK